MILHTVVPRIPHLRHITIDEVRIHQVCEGLDLDRLQLPTWDDTVFILDPPEDRAAQIILFNTVNFSYWGRPKWTIDFRGQPQDGAWGMLGAIARAVQDEDFPLFDGAYLANISASDFRHILRGNVEIPMFQQRLEILHEVGSVLVDQFDGSFIELIRAAENDAVALVRLLVTRFPPFNDVATLDGHTVAFYKRAQLATAMVYESFGGEGLGDLRRTEELTVFADYKLPQVLRRLGVLRYADHLAERVDRLEPLEAGSRGEIEIRAATVWAGELMRRQLAARSRQITPHSAVTALHIDYWLWREGQVQGPGIKPYHRTRSIYY